MLAAVQALIAAAAVAHGVSAAAMLTVAQRESHLDRAAVNSEGCIGLYQLCPGSELRTFWLRGYDNPMDPAQQANFVAERFSEGACARAWAATCPLIAGSR